MDFTIAISRNDNGLDSQENKPVKRSDFQTKTANFPGSEHELSKLTFRLGPIRHQGFSATVRVFSVSSKGSGRDPKRARLVSVLPRCRKSDAVPKRARPVSDLSTIRPSGCDE